MSTVFTIFPVNKSLNIAKMLGTIREHEAVGTTGAHGQSGEMNEFLKSGRGGCGLNVREWVFAAADFERRQQLIDRRATDRV
jgi:hypothetical protein